MTDLVATTASAASPTAEAYRGSQMTWKVIGLLLVVIVPTAFWLAALNVALAALGLPFPASAQIAVGLVTALIPALVWAAMANNRQREG